MAGRRGGRAAGIELDGLEVRLEALLQFDARLLEMWMHDVKKNIYVDRWGDS